jgi:hypothetical protein
MNQQGDLTPPRRVTDPEPSGRRRRRTTTLLVAKRGAHSGDSTAACRVIPIESRAKPSLYTNLATRSRQRREICLHPQLIAPDVRFVAVHRTACNLQPPCSIPPSGCTPRHTGAARRLAMEIVGLVMLGSIVLYLLLQVDDLTA